MFAKFITHDEIYNLLINEKPLILILKKIMIITKFNVALPSVDGVTLLQIIIIFNGSQLAKMKK